MHTESISKIFALEYVKKHIKSKCEYYMKIYGYNPLDNPLQKCDNIRVWKERNYESISYTNGNSRTYGHVDSPGHGRLPRELPSSYIFCCA